MNHLANVWVFSDNSRALCRINDRRAAVGRKSLHGIVQGNTRRIDYVALGADEIVILESHTDLQRVGKTMPKRWPRY